jgi:hypothetical protein
MRYMFLVYSVETADGKAQPQSLQEIAEEHRRVINEAAQKLVLQAAEPLKPTNMATTVRRQNGKALILDGPVCGDKGTARWVLHSRLSGSGRGHRMGQENSNGMQRG